MGRRRRLRWEVGERCSLAWRTDDDISPPTTAMIEIALAESHRHGWLRRELAAGARPWIPTDEPVHTAVLGSSSEGAVTGR